MESTATLVIAMTGFVSALGALLKVWLDVRSMDRANQLQQAELIRQVDELKHKLARLTCLHEGPSREPHDRQGLPLT